jgi:adenosine/AMP kinase
VRIEKPEKINFVLGQTHFDVCRIFCATANPTEVIVAETEQGRGIPGVIDGHAPKGVEGAEEILCRKGFLRQIGYKL